MGSIATPSPETLLTVAAKVTEYAQQLTKELEASNVPPVTLEVASPIKYESLPGNAFFVRQQLEDALKDMYILRQGPSRTRHRDTERPQPVRLLERRTRGWNGYTRADRKIPPLPLYSTHLALQPSPGTRDLAHLCRWCWDETSPPMMLLPEALRRFTVGKSEISRSQKETAFRLCHSGGVWGDHENTWHFLENDGEGEKKGWRQRNFIKFMAYIKDLFKTESIVLDAIDWKAAGEATVVDLGGSAGHDDIVLAKAYPNLKIIVQDLPQVTSIFEKEFPVDLKSCVSFLTHNLFDPQPVSADIYVLKLILHDWPDVESVAILKALVPALKPGARVVFIDYVGKNDPNEDVALPYSMRAFGTATDMRMMTLSNAKERPVPAWKDIFKQADERYEVSSVKADPLTFVSGTVRWASARTSEPRAPGQKGSQHDNR
ncbi:S-adenosyl-L-methionine-dependent methyltransferase [Lizonia empirigonia]|nr:S-adenosyl-L-methionine-dependent methyltransferase [Lizonia empirigonia]